MFGRRRKPPWWARPLPFIGVLLGLIFGERYAGHLLGSIRLEAVVRTGKNLYEKYLRS
ncbi:hypothetical protein KQI63_01055 [bacterium]|nr:hypothetical protein [bacterium]